MGNCHAVDPVSATVEHPDGKVEKLYFSSSARQLMLQHPGHYVALLPPPPPPSPDGSVVLHVKRKLKLLPPDSMLNVGSCYKLVSFEDVLSELSDNGSMAHQTSRRAKQAKVVQVSEQGKVVEGQQQQQQQSVSKAVKHINQLRAMLSKSMFVSQQQQQQQKENIPQDVVPGLTRGGISRSFSSSSSLESVRPVARGGVWRPNLQSIAERGR